MMLLRRFGGWGSALALALVVSLGMPGCSDDDTTSPQNYAPIITSVVVNPPSTSGGGTVTVTVTASDQDGDALSYTYTPNGGSISGTGSTVSWTAPSAAGAYSVSVKVTDGKGGEATGSGSLTVTPAMTGISGAARVLAGVQVDLRNSRVAIYQSFADWNADRPVQTVTAVGTEYAVTFTFTNLAPGTYYLDLWKDMDNSATYNALDLFGFYGTGIWPQITFSPITVLQNQNTNIGEIIVIEL